jgi:trimeric autotransporter adhesin
MRRSWMAGAALFLLVSTIASAQAPQRLVRFGGTLRDTGGKAATGDVTILFGIFTEQEGGTPLWSESQVVTLDADGRYAVLLGATERDGLPIDLFMSGATRWLGVHVPALADPPRVLLVGVPYAVKAADADTVGGKPLSAFVLAGDRTGVGADGLTYVDTRVLSSGLTSGGNGQAPGGPPSPLGGAGTPNYLGVFTDTTTLVNSVIYQTPAGNIGVNTTTPAAGFHAVSAASPVAYFDVYSDALGALPVVYRAARGTPASPSPVQTNDILGGLAVRGYGATGFTQGRGQVMYKAAENWTDSANGTYLQFTTTPAGSVTWAERMRIDATGNVGIGTATPAQRLSVAGAIESTAGGFKFPDGTTQATAGLQSVTAGNGITVGSVSGGTQYVGLAYSGGGGDYGSSTYIARLDHLHDGRYLRLTGGSLAASTGSGGVVLGVAQSGAGHGVLVTAGAGHGISATSSNGDGVHGVSTWGDGVEGTSTNGWGTGGISTYGDGIHGESTNSRGVYGHGGTIGVLGATSSTVAGNAGVEGITTSAAYGVYGLSAGSGAGMYAENQSGNSASVALIAKNTGSGGAASFEAGSPGSVDVVAVTSSAASPYASLYVNNLNGSGGFGIYGSAYNGGTAVTGWTDSGTGVRGGAASGSAVYGRATGSGYGGYFQSATGFAGYFSGNVHVAGTLSASVKTFKIDHPLDPEGKYLSHAVVESPDMKNIYDGIAVLDAAGEAWVTLPDYFEALNKDFRYQLTPVGAAFVPYVAEEIAGNRFKIGGGTAGTKVSWQVTGTRQDAYAKAHPVVVEQMKPADEQGTYLHPELFGQPADRAAGSLKVEPAAGGGGDPRPPMVKR